MGKQLKLSELITNDTIAIVASNLVLALAIIGATRKTPIGDATTKEIFEAFKSFTSLLKIKD